VPEPSIRSPPAWTTTSPAWPQAKVLLVIAPPLSTSTRPTAVIVTVPAWPWAKVLLLIAPPLSTSTRPAAVTVTAPALPKEFGVARLSSSRFGCKCLKQGNKCLLFLGSKI